MPPDFLNSREDAGLIWTGVVLACVIYKSPRLTGSMLGLVWIAVKPPLLFLFGGAAIYCAGILVAADELGIWHPSATKETVYWFVGTALVLAGQAAEERPSPDYVRTLLRRAFKVAVVTEFVINLYVFPLAFELVLVPVVSVFILLDAWNQAQERADQRVVKFTDGGLVTIGWLLLLSVVLRIGIHLGDLVARETLERLLVVPGLTLSFIPFLCLVAWYSRRQMEGLRRRLALD